MCLHVLTNYGPTHNQHMVLIEGWSGFKKLGVGPKYPFNGLYFSYSNQEE